jgi:hypothetical protein
LWEKWYGDERWTRAFEVRKAGLIGSAPSVAIHSDGEQDVFWRGSNGNLYEIRFNGTWSAPENLGGGQLSSVPSAGADAAGNDYVVWRGTDSRLWGMSSTSGQWNQALPLNGVGLVSAPTIAIQADGEQDVFWRGRDDQLQETWNNDGIWRGPVSLHARLSSQPDAGVDAAGKQATPVGSVEPHRDR